MRKIADYFGVSIGWLLGDEDAAPAPSNTKNLPLVLAEPAGTFGKGTGQMAPLISWASAGDAKAFIDQGYDVEWIPTSCKDPHCYCLAAEGDSMEPKYSKGDIIFVAPSQVARNGDLVIAKTKHDDVYFKIYHWSGNYKDAVKLTSLNPAWPVIEIPQGSLHFVQPVHSVLKRLRRDV